jgi:ribose transport system substrate-binding protein
MSRNFKRRRFLKTLSLCSIGFTLPFVVSCANAGQKVQSISSQSNAATAPRVKYAAPIPLAAGSQANFDRLRNQGTIRVAFMPIAPEFNYYAQMAKGVQQVARQNGVEAFLQGPPGSGDNNVHFEMMQQVVQQGNVNAIIIAVRDADLVAPVVRQAVEAGIAIIVANSDLKSFPAPVHAVVGYVNHTANKAMGEYAAKLARGTRLRVGVIEGAPGYHSTQAVGGFLDGIRGSTLEVVSSMDGKWSIQGGEQAATSMLQAHPNIGLIWAANDNMILGASRVAQMNRRSDLILLGRDGDPNALKEIVSGKITATTDTNPLGIGEVAMQIAIDALAGRFQGGFVEQPTTIVDRNNVSRFLQNS